MRIEPGGGTTITIQTTDEAETRAVAARLAAELAGGEVIGLRGDLGAGKTVFVQGLSCGLGSREPATSPSFVIMHQYTGRLRLCHVDLYRLDVEQAEALALEEFIAPDTVIAIEWSERLPARLRRRLFLDIAIEFGAGENERVFRLSCLEASYADPSNHSAGSLRLRSGQAGQAGSGSARAFAPSRVEGESRADRLRRAILALACTPQPASPQTQ
jgi:tRNA threonylcarbamoyladenosine biosynthesis protein TsaE